MSEGHKIWKKICQLVLNYLVKFIYSEKATKVCEISFLDLPYVVTVKSTVDILQNFVAFSEYMNFKGKFEMASAY